MFIAKMNTVMKIQIDRMIVFNEISQTKNQLFQKN